jgi:hemoglobin-like flavoprotein
MLVQRSSIPARTLYALTKTISTSPWATNWQRVYRQIFWLADGQRDIQRICQLLHKSDTQIIRATGELAVNGYLSIQTEKKTLLMDVTLLKQSFYMVVPIKEEFARSFYQRLFSYYPATKPLFAHTNMKRQESSLMATLAAVVAGVERGDNLVPTLSDLGKKHQRYGAAAEHYPLVGGVLLETFHEHLGSALTPAIQDAWSQAFEIISTQMLVGAEEGEKV